MDPLRPRVRRARRLAARSLHHLADPVDDRRGRGMSLKAKKTRRWLLLLAGVATLGGLAGGAYFLRVRQLEDRLLADYAAGRRALAAGDHAGAMHKIGAYLQ